jgi:ATP-dependent exoDNAse (exonuclease V) beta subunit
LFSASFENERQKTALDNVNLLYVAFTRARERLYVYYLESKDSQSNKKPDTSPKLSTVGDAIKAVRSAALESGAVQVTESYERGMEQPPHESRKPKGASMATELLSLPWHKRIRMEKKHKKHWAGSLSALQQNTMGIPLETVAAEALRRLDTQADLTKVLKDLVEEGLLQQRDHMSLRIKLDRILGEANMQSWFSPEAEVRKEAEILTEDAELYHPSRLIIQGTLAHVLDFVVADEIADLRKHQQSYAKNLRKMGFKKVELHIFDIGTETYLVS